CNIICFFKIFFKQILICELKYRFNFYQQSNIRSSKVLSTGEDLGGAILKDFSAKAYMEKPLLNPPPRRGLSCNSFC
ncbi:MAG: hypothetical protein ACXWEY_15220, partial [Bacteroidia bacterium]